MGNKLNKYCQIFFGTEQEWEAQKIIDALFEAKLIACADSFPISANYCWRGRIQREKRIQVTAYSKFDLKDKIIAEVEKIHSDEVPSIVFTEVSANDKYLEWIEESII